MPDPSIADLMQRIERLEDTHHIQQLAMRYALAVDERNIDEFVRLFVPDVWVGGGRSGRDALHDIITPQLRLFYRSVHLICGQQITFHEDGRATWWGRQPVSEDGAGSNPSVALGWGSIRLRTGP